jgi:ribonuclease D
MSKEYQENITAEQIRTLDLKWFEGEIILVDNLVAFKEVIRKLSNSEILGFDTETRPSFRRGRRNNVSLLQLANARIACLFRINHIGIPDELVDLLSDRNIIKSGVALHDDIRFLKNVRRFEPDGFIDLQKLVREYNIESTGLKKLTAIVLGFRISKSQQVTNWEATSLTDAQKLYAATDAWVCYEIYKKLKG